MNRLDTCASSRCLTVLEIELWLGSLIEVVRFTLSSGLKHLPSSSRLSWSHVFQKVDHQLRHILLQRSGFFPKLSFRSFAIEPRYSRFHSCVGLEGTCLEFEALGYRDISGPWCQQWCSAYWYELLKSFWCSGAPYSLTVSTTLKVPVHLGSNSDFPLVSWVPNNTKSPISKLEKSNLQFPFFFLWPALPVVFLTSPDFLLVSLCLLGFFLPSQVYHESGDPPVFQEEQLLKLLLPMKLTLSFLRALWMKGKACTVVPKECEFRDKDSQDCPNFLVDLFHRTISLR